MDIFRIKIIVRHCLFTIGANGKDADKIQNIMCLCRTCHTKAHSILSKDELQFIHNNVMQGNHKQFIK